MSSCVAPSGLARVRTAAGQSTACGVMVRSLALDLGCVLRLKDELMEELNELVELDDLAELDGFVVGEKEVAKNQQIGVINPGK